MNKSIAVLTGVLIGIGCLAYLAGVAWACVESWPSHSGNYEMPHFVTDLVTSISAILATNLGAVLGIGATNPHSSFAQTAAWNPLNIGRNPSPQVFQTAACYVYIISLVVAGVVWAKRGFITDADQIVSIIPEFTKTLAGVIVGVLAIALNSNAGKSFSVEPAGSKKSKEQSPD